VQGVDPQEWGRYYSRVQYVSAPSSLTQPPTYNTRALANPPCSDIIKGFAAQAEASALEFVTTMGSKYSMEMEEDGIVTTQDQE
jgi:hypothetical protein